jgi:hypothetical protein
MPHGTKTDGLLRLGRLLRSGVERAVDIQHNSPYVVSVPGHTDPYYQNSAPYMVNLVNPFPFNRNHLVFPP